MGEGGAAGQRVSGSGVTLRERSDRGDRSSNTAAWHLWVDDTARPGYANMAIDLALLDRAERQGESWLRLYHWQPHCLSFGRHEPASRRYDVERIRELGLDVVRRPTGGRAVWHSRELTYGVACPTERLGSLRAAYQEIHAMLAEAMRRLGAAASLAPAERSLSLDAGACFSQPVGGEVMVAGQKVVGSAQLRRGTALLQHGSVLLEDDQGIVGSVTRGAQSDRARSSALASVLGRRVTRLDLAAAIGSAAAACWPGAWTWVSRPDYILGAASEYYPQFRSPAWTWAR